MHFKSNIARMMPMKITPIQEDIRTSNHVSSNTVPKNVINYIYLFILKRITYFFVLTIFKIENV